MTNITLGQKQRLFAKLIAELISWIYEQGYEVTIGDVFRDPRVFGEMGVKRGYGISTSNHKLKLAADLNLFKHGRYLDDTEDHRFIGEKWESMCSLCAWGGHFDDGNHYSFKHNGTR